MAGTSSPRRALGSSPYPLAGFAGAGGRTEPRRSKAENGFWGSCRARSPEGEHPAVGAPLSFSLLSLSAKSAVTILEQAPRSFWAGTQNQEVGPQRALRGPVAAEDSVLR